MISSTCQLSMLVNPDAPVETGAEYVTVLTSNDKTLTKVFTLEDGRLTGTAANVGTVFSVDRFPVTGLSCLSTLLTRLEGQPDKMVIRGEPREGINLVNSRRLSKGASATFKSVPLKWALIDIDGIELPPEMEDFNACSAEIVSHARNHLPQEFRDTECHWQFSSSMGVKPGRIKLHLWFWLSRSVSDES